MLCIKHYQKVIGIAVVDIMVKQKLKELQDIFSLIDDNADLSKEPFSKLKRDMAYELGLV